MIVQGEIFTHIPGGSANETSAQADEPWSQSPGVHMTTRVVGYFYIIIHVSILQMVAEN